MTVPCTCKTPDQRRACMVNCTEAGVPPCACGCTDFLHNGGCSDQNVLDPLGAIRDPRHRQQVRGLLIRYFGGKVP